MSKEIIIYHGSHNIIETPTFGVGNPNNDYGLGFYCTEYLNLAKEWACDETSGGYANKYSLDLSGLKILNLNSKDYCIIHWISVLLKNRIVSLYTDMDRNAMNYILENFPINTENYDIVIGYRADDSYFSFARDFLGNAITVQRLSQVMRLGELGNQIVLKSKRAFSQIKFLGYEEAHQDIYYPLRKRRDDFARESYFSNREGFNIDKNSLYMIDIIRGGIKPNDPRL